MWPSERALDITLEPPAELRWLGGQSAVWRIGQRQCHLNSDLRHWGLLLAVGSLLGLQWFLILWTKLESLMTLRNGASRGPPD